MQKNRGVLYLVPSALRKIAVKWIDDMPTTKAERNSEIMSLPSREGMTRDDARKLCEEAARKCKSARFGRICYKVGSRLGRPVSCICGQFRNVKTGRQSSKSNRSILRRGDLRTRLAKRISSIILDIYRDIYRFPAVGHGDEYVRIAEFPGVNQEQSCDWEKYKGRWKGTPATITDTTIFVCRDYLSRVYLKQLCVVDECLVIYAQLYEIAGKTTVYSAKWLKQSRGYSVIEVDGYVAVNKNGAKSGDTPEQALRKLSRLTKGRQVIV